MHRTPEIFVIAVSFALVGPVLAAVSAGETGSSPETAQPASSSAEAPSAEASEIQKLIRKLGADSFHTREEAMAKLIEIGPAAEAAVKAAYSSPDPEVAYRARKIVKEIDRSQLSQRRAAFLEGDIEQLKLNAESWERMAKLVGNTREARELFVQMQVAAEDLLTTAEKDPRRCAQKIAQLDDRDRHARRFGGEGLAPGVVAAMVFVGSDDDVSLDSSTMRRCTSLLYRHRGTLGDNEVFRQLLGKWVTADASGSQQYQLLRLAQQFKLDEGVELARKMVKDARPNSYKAHAMMTLGMFGGREDVGQLEKLIDNDARVGAITRGKKRIECRLGDVALAMAIALTDQKAKDYGFPNAPNGRPTSTSYYNYGFSKNENRQAARKKWEEYKEQTQSKD